MCPLCWVSVDNSLNDQEKMLNSTEAQQKFMNNLGLVTPTNKLYVMTLSMINFMISKHSK